MATASPAKCFGSAIPGCGREFLDERLPVETGFGPADVRHGPVPGPGSATGLTNPSINDSERKTKHGSNYRPGSGGDGAQVLSLLSPQPQVETDFAATHHCSFWSAG